MQRLRYWWARADSHGPQIYRGAVLFALGIVLAHILALPIGITYDGHVYLDLADVVGSSRFPRDWNLARAPLFPLALKISFSVFGRQPLAAIFVTSVAGLAGVLMTGALASHLSGKTGGALVLILLSLNPMLVSYEHFVLSETGTAAFFAAIVSLSLWYPADSRHLWLKAVGLSALLAGGYYWRQNILYLALPAAVLHSIGGWRRWSPSISALNLPSRTRCLKYSPLMAQALLVMVGSYAATIPARRYVGGQQLQEVMLRFGIVKQALPAPEDYWIGEDAEFYRFAIKESRTRGTFYSGMRADLADELLNKLVSRPQTQSASRLFLRLVKEYPGRYLGGVTRTFMSFAGAKGLQDENRIWRDQMLSPTFLGSKIGDGPPKLDATIKEQFLQRSQPSAVLWLFRRLKVLYENLLPLAFLMLMAGVLASLVIRSLALFTFCILPIVYLVPYVLTLLSIDRYAFPVYPVVLSALVVVPTLLARHFGRRSFSK